MFGFKENASKANREYNDECETYIKKIQVHIFLHFFHEKDYVYVIYEI